MKKNKPSAVIRLVELFFISLYSKSGSISTAEGDFNKTNALRSKAAFSFWLRKKDSTCSAEQAARRL